MTFAAICVPTNPAPISPEPFAHFCRNIAQYRNQIHEDVMGMVEYQSADICQDLTSSTSTSVGPD